MEMQVATFVALVGTLLGVSLVVKRHSYRKAADVVGQSGRPGRLRLYYFWTPSCVQCRRAQGPIVDQLGAELNSGVDIVAVNAHDDPDTAPRFGIWSVPTTVVVGADGEVRHVNTGYVDRAGLQEQLGLARPVGSPDNGAKGTAK